MILPSALPIWHGSDLVPVWLYKATRLRKICILAQDCYFEETSIYGSTHTLTYPPKDDISLPLQALVELYEYLLKCSCDMAQEAPPQRKSCILGKLC